MSETKEEIVVDFTKYPELHNEIRNIVHATVLPESHVIINLLSNAVIAIACVKNELKNI